MKPPCPPPPPPFPACLRCCSANCEKSDLLSLLALLHRGAPHPHHPRTCHPGLHPMGVTYLRPPAVKCLFNAVFTPRTLKEAGRTDWSPGWAPALAPSVFRALIHRWVLLLISTQPHQCLTCASAQVYLFRLLAAFLLSTVDGVPLKRIDVCVCGAQFLCEDGNEVSYPPAGPGRLNPELWRYRQIANAGRVLPASVKND
ncbi:hypothetical protein JZ751_027260 [Albula glossodonta]|uniref:Uncharacterized protein n=1 Tax=Albula glossodonta TaxID=121402 RepID=A0A8T2NGF5_9TELE|nr:hypothetical protein JZ751_027260 [Albula glossodonta]